MPMSNCEHVTNNPDDKILASQSNTVYFFTATSEHAAGSISLQGGYVKGIQSYRMKIYVAIEFLGRGDKLAIYDQQFVEVKHWFTNVKASDLAVNNGRIYLATPDAGIHVYSASTYKFLYSFTEGSGERLTSHALPDVLIVTNHEKDQVSAVNGVTKEVLWTTEADKPWGVCMDEYETIWVWSEFQQGLYILDEKGRLWSCTKLCTSRT